MGYVTSICNKNIPVIQPTNGGIPMQTNTNHIDHTMLRPTREQLRAVDQEMQRIFRFSTHDEFMRMFQHALNLACVNN